MCGRSSAVGFWARHSNWALLAILAAAGICFGTTEIHAQDKPRVVFSDNPKDATDAKSDLLLRPNTLHKVYVYVQNPTATAKKLSVKLLAGEEQAEIAKSAVVSVDPEKSSRVTLTVMPPPDPKEPWPEITGKLQAVLVDDKNEELDKRPVAVSVLTPPNYVEVSFIEYDGEQNLLLVRLKAQPTFSGPPCKVNLVLRPDRIPGLLAIPDKDMSQGAVLRKDKEALLFARNFKFKDEGSGNGLVYLTVDGYERAFVYETTFDRRGGKSKPTRKLGPPPTLNIDAARYTQPNAKYSVRLEVDHPPSGNVRLELALARPGIGVFETQKFTGGRQQQIRFSLDKDGCLLVKPEVRDWSTELDLSEALGDRQLQARLFDSQGRVVEVQDIANQRVDTVTREVTVDKTRPEDVQFITPPARLRVDKPLVLTAKGSDPESQIAEIFFFIGKPTPEGDLPKEVKKIKAALVSDKTGATGSATIPVPPDQKDPLEVTAAFVNGAGLPAYATTVLQVASAATAGANTGTVKGSVVEGELTQPKLDVVLLDDKGMEKGRVKTNDKGEFTFEEVAPGKYTVATAKSTSRTKGSMKIEVEKGKTAEAAIKLFR